VAVEVVIPMLGVTVENGKIIEWLKDEGDTVEKGESIFVVEADKVTTEVESPSGGTLAKILLPVGETVSVLTVVAVITEPGEPLPQEYRGEIPTAPAGMPVSPVAAAPAPFSLRPPGPIRIVPAARKRAQEKQIPIETLSGTGPDGVICLRDVEAAASPLPIPAKASRLARQAAEKRSVPLESVTGTGVRGRIMRSDVEKGAANTAPPAPGRVIPMSSMRRVIARRMTESAFTAPHTYFFTDVDIDPLIDFRGRLLPEFERRFALRLSINDLLIKALALNLLDFPILNAVVKGEEIHILPEVNVGLAVALSDGLIVPAVSGADSAGLADIVRQRIDLVSRALQGKLALSEIERGTFTVSSLARYDITHFTAILNPPQSGILSVGKAREALYLEDGTVKARKVLSLGLSVDHRIIDGVVAADFLQTLKRRLENPLFTFTCI
jgi:pyruvate dehydrogenase E2 component (dihydrolipoamide acetyltransferase)